MATIDYSRNKRANIKSAVRAASYTFDVDELLTTDNFVLFNLPPEAVVIGYVVNTSSVGAGTLDIGFVGGSEIASAVDISSVGASANTTLALATGSGKVVTVTPSASTANWEGSITVLFIEPELKDGEMMNLYEE